MSTVIHGASIDLEDWYHDVEHVPTSAKGRFSEAAFRDAFERQVAHIVRILDDTRTRATFFVLGKTAERAPAIVRALALAGHEIASHGYGHEMVYDLREDRFRDDVRRAQDVLARITGVAPLGYRAPYFSVRREQTWFYDVLAELGLTYSSSVFPFTGRTGYETHALSPVSHVTRSGAVVHEIPVAVVEQAGVRVPIAGGGFWRLAPRFAIERAIVRLEREQRPFVMYLHPHEFDDEPLRSHRGTRRNASVNLGRKTVPGKLRHLLARFTFRPVGEIAAHASLHGSIGNGPASLTR